jgi:hypothetical protein
MSFVQNECLGTRDLTMLLSMKLFIVTGPFAFLCLSWYSHLNSFEKNDILRIVRALAIFRPSLIALQMPLSLDDEIFVEKCFQRTLLVRHISISFFSPIFSRITLGVG